jgi:hypothetical protein
MNELKTKKRTHKRTGLLAGFFLLWIGGVLSACNENPERLQHKLHTQLQDDLRYIVAEVESKSGNRYLLDTPYYEIRDLRLYSGDSAWKIAGYAEVDYFYFHPDSIRLFQTRKYRYMTKDRFWDRYFKKVKHIGQYKATKNTNEAD